MLRTVTCGELRAEDADKTVDLCGWVHHRRDHGGVIFIDLRDRYGLTQVVFDPSYNSEAHKAAEHLSREDVIKVKGKVRPRKEGMVNDNLETGAIEVVADLLDILNKSETPPIEIEDRINLNDNVRLKYRYLDLRRPSVQSRLVQRHEAAQAVRQTLNSLNFVEIETPLLVRATPEGARDYIVPSRVNPGKVYALPQSPQIYKQLLMVAGFDRYYQLAKCLRDEDLRADRQPEFTQIDMEMSFVEPEDVYETVEFVVKSIYDVLKKADLKIPFKRMTYDEAMTKYGTDKPDLRFGMELNDITELCARSDFKIFKDIAASGGMIKCLVVKDGVEKLSRKRLEYYDKFIKTFKAKGLSWFKITEKVEGPLVKFFDENLVKEILDKAGAGKNDLVLVIGDSKPKVTNNALAELRNALAKELKLYDENEFRFVWIVDFPLFEWDDDNDRWAPAHHMFTMPKPEHIEYIESDPGKVYAQCFDLVLNGIELGSGSIRIHNPELQKLIMKAINLSEEEAEKKFGFMLNAFKYGAPPHGGFAVGFDRLVALLSGTNDIREVMAFPKNKAAQSPMDGSPSSVSDDDLKELHLKWDIVKED